MRPASPDAPQAPPRPLTDRYFIIKALDSVVDCVKFLDPDGVIRYMNTNGTALMEIEDVTTVVGRPWTELWPNDARALVADAVEEARDCGSARFSAECPTGRGVLKWWDVSVSPVRDERGDLLGFVSISRDITAAKREEEASALLAKELQHRIKNLFTVVDGLTAMSLRRAPEHAEFGATLRARLAALGKAVEHLAVAHTGADVGLHSLLNQIIAPYEHTSESGKRIAISGADTPLGRAGATAVALFAHELATNAIKHGALARPGGRVEVSIAQDANDLRLEWSERSRTATPSPARMDGGFGSTLIDTSIKTHLEGRIERTWSEHGLTVAVVVPLAALTR